MRECENCHRKVQFVIWLVDTGEQDFDPTPRGLLEAGQYWCLDCVRGYRLEVENPFNWRYVFPGPQQQNLKGRLQGGRL